MLMPRRRAEFQQMHTCDVSLRGDDRRDGFQINTMNIAVAGGVRLGRREDEIVVVHIQSRVLRVNAGEGCPLVDELLASKLATGSGPNGITPITEQWSNSTE